MFRYSSSRFSFQVYKNFVPPPSAVDFVEAHFRKSAISHGHKTKLMASEFLDSEIKSLHHQHRQNKKSTNKRIPLYSSHCGGVNINSRKCSRIIDQDENYTSNQLDQDGNNNNTERDNEDINTNEKSSSPNSCSSCCYLPRNEATFSPISKTAEGYSIFENHLNAVNSNNSNRISNGDKQQHRVVPPFSVFEGNAKDQWIDNTLGWCHLCQEPTGTASNHVGDRDHACMAYYLYLYTLYPRTWSTREMVLHSLSKFPSVTYNAVSTPFSCEHLHTLDDCQRRLELESLLVHLSNPNSPNQVLANVLQGTAPIALWVAGERIFKPNISQLISEMCPPMGAGIQTAVTQKCWSRTNLERMYDALNIAKIQKSFGSEPKTGRLEKAFFMRTLFFELHGALDETRGDEKKVPQVVFEDDEENEICAVDDDNDELQFGYDYYDATKRLLVQECLRRMAFELVYMQTMIYMNRIQYVARTLKTPTWLDLNSWDSL